MRTVETVRMSTKGQVVIPKKIRESLRIEPGTWLEVRMEDGDVVLRPAEKSPLEWLKGCAKGQPLLDDLEREHADELAKEAGS